MQDAFHGIRVVDFADGIAGSYCAKLLADYGAETVKVEPPEGNLLRQYGPFPGGIADCERSGLFLYLNTNKRGVVADNGTPDGVELAQALSDASDIAVIDTPLSAFPLRRHSRLIVVSVTPFGSTGPYAGLPGSDLVAMAMSGVVRSTPGNVDDLAAQPPLRPGGRQGDFSAGLAAAFAAGLALVERERSGEGQDVDVSELETLVSFMFYDTAAYGYDPSGTYVRRAADRRVTGGYPRTSIGIWPCRDGYVCIAIREQHHFQRFVEAMGNPPWGADERFMTRAARGEARDVLNPLMLEWTMQHTVDEVWRLAQQFDLPITPCNDLPHLVRNDQLQDRRFFVTQDLDDERSILMPRGPFAAGPWRLRRPAPKLGEHTGEVQAELETRRSSLVAETA
jgi:crotonobetainyl-CoA:carnitine CoA-transferase CaiB-like acyl-CoA transferase